MIRESRIRHCLLPPASRPLLGSRVMGLEVMGALMGLLLLACALLFPPLSWAATPSPRELLDGGRADEALRLLTRQATGNNAAAFNYLGRTYFSLGDWDNAVRYCERASQLDPRNAEYQLWLGRSYGEKANAASALFAYSLARKTVAAFESARSLDRNSMPIARDLSEYYFTAPSIVGGGIDKALALAAQLAPEHPSDAAWVRAMVASRGGEHDKAEREYNDSIRFDHNSAATYLEFARYLRGRGSWDRFQQTVERAIHSTLIRPINRYDAAEMLLRADRDMPMAAQQMRAYIQSGNTDEAAPLFRAHFLLGEILLKSGDAGQATAEYRAALALASSYRPAADSLRRLGQTRARTSRPFLCRRTTEP
jgi:tetratricopeptide (TPR) repeat protein